MRKTIMVLLVVSSLIGATGIASARMGSMGGYYDQHAGDGNWFNQMYRWMNQHMGSGFGHMMGYGYDIAEGYCPGFGAGYHQDTDTEPVTLEEATELLEEAVEGTITSDVYQMGHWYVIFYEDSEGNLKQARIDIFTGEVYTDFYGYMSEYTGTYDSRGYGGAGRMMWGC